MMEHDPSPLWLSLMKKFAVGKLSACDVQEVAECALNSGCDAPDIHTLAGLGASGNTAGNIHRDLMRKFFKNLQSPQPFTVTAPVQLKEEGQKIVKPGPVSLLLPHEWVQCLQDHDILEELSCTDADLATFWQGQKIHLK